MIEPATINDFHLSILTNDLAAVQNFVEKNKSTLDQSIRFLNGYTPLSFSIFKSYIRISLYLIEQRIGINQHSDDQVGRKEPPIHTALRLRQFEVITSLLECPELDVNQSDLFGLNVLNVALKERLFQFLPQIIGHDSFRVSFISTNPLQYAIQRRMNSNIVNLLIDIGYTIITKSVQDAILYRIYLDNKECFYKFIQQMEFSCGKKLLIPHDLQFWSVCPFTLKQICRHKLRQTFSGVEARPILPERLNKLNLDLPLILNQYICDLSVD